MIAGQLVRTKSLSTIRGRAVTVRIIRPDFTEVNIQELVRLSEEWQEQALATARTRQDIGDAAVHALFASDVAFIAASGLQAKQCCILVALDFSDKIVGLSLYRLDPRAQVWLIDFHTTSPENQPGYPSEDKIRGIGTTLLGVAAEDMISQNCTQVQLYALDSDSERFWRNRGFHNTQEPLRMSCTETQALAQELSTSHPDDPQKGDEPFAGEKARLAAVTPPRFAHIFRV